MDRKTALATRDYDALARMTALGSHQAAVQDSRKPKNLQEIPLLVSPLPPDKNSSSPRGDLLENEAMGNLDNRQKGRELFAGDKGKALLCSKSSIESLNFDPCKPY